eukprot:m.167839 g.167839  ORF g.167839 m.167839 type:complete len:269 (-) comp17777_c3_seq1:62-868(-)
MSWRKRSKSTTSKGKDDGLAASNKAPPPAASLRSFSVRYLGCADLPEGTEPGPEACYHALGLIEEHEDSIDTKVALTVSVYGLHALRTQFSGLSQSEAAELGGGGVSFHTVSNQSIYRIAFCTDIDKHFCYIAQEQASQKFQCYAYKCKSKKDARKVSEATAAACARVFSTLTLLKAKVRSLEEANRAVTEAHARNLVAAQVDTESLIDLIRYEGYDDADELFRKEMLELAGVAPLPYQPPSPTGVRAPSQRTLVRQADPNEYERTRF